MVRMENEHELVVELADMLSVISDINRLRILRLLVHQESCVCDIMSVLELGQSLASHHLGVLRRAGLIQDRHDAQWVYYSIVPEKLAELNAQFRQLLAVDQLSPEAAYGASPSKCN